MTVPRLLGAYSKDAMVSESESRESVVEKVGGKVKREGVTADSASLRQNRKEFGLCNTNVRHL